jgi:ubiquinone/menaquinone biosynthesis C-methylase UbiE
MVTKNEIKEAYDFIADDYDDYMEKTNHAKAQRKIIELLKGEIRGSVIDIGTGTGIIAVSIARKLPDSEVTAVDISERMIEQAKGNTRRAGVDVNFYVGDIEGLLFPDNSFNVVICCLGMLWFINKEKALKEMMRICKDVGKIILIEEKGETLMSKRDAEKTVFNERLLGFFSKIEELETPISPGEIEEKLNKAGYELTKKVSAGIDENHGFVGMVFEA